MKKYWTFIIKATHRCNFGCTYCFEDKGRALPDLTEAGAKTIFLKIKHYFSRGASKPHGIHIIWHGGEPLLAGPRRLGRFFKLAKDIVGPNVGIFCQSVQTNGSLINDAFIKVFKKYNVQPGLSFDVCGNERRDRSGKSVRSRVMKKMKRLQANGVDTGYISVVTSKNADDPKKFYSKMRQINLPVTLCPVKIVTRREQHELRPHPRVYGRFLVKIARMWLSDRKADFPIEPLNHYLSVLKDKKNAENSCSTMKNCAGEHLHIMANGDVTPCDNFTVQPYVFGNIFRNPLGVILNSPKRKVLFGRNAVIRKMCKGCRWLDMCNGGCPGTAMHYGSFFEKTYYCESVKMFYETFRQISKTGRK